MINKIATIVILLVFAAGMMFYDLSGSQLRVEAPAANAVQQ